MVHTDTVDKHAHYGSERDKRVLTGGSDFCGWQGNECRLWNGIRKSQSMVWKMKNRGPEEQMTIVPDDLLIGTSGSGDVDSRLIWILRQTKEWFYFGASFVSPIRTGVGNNTDCHWLLDFANFDEGWSFPLVPSSPSLFSPPNNARHLTATQ